MKRFLIIVIVSIVILAAVAGFIVFMLTQSGSGLFGRGGEELRQWIGRQVTAIVNDNLKPELTFERLEYAFPGTVTIHRPSLTTTDAEPIEVVAAASMAIELAETPVVGQPIVIERITLVEPTVRLIEQEGGGLAGFSNLLEEKPGGKKDSGGSSSPSDVFAIRLIRIENGILVYEPLDEPAMRLDQLTFDLNNEPSGQKGWYNLDVVLERAQVFAFDIDGRLNIDSRVLELNEGTAFDVHLEPDNHAVLPPQLQTMLKQYGVRGALEADVSGRIPFDEVLQSSLALNLELNDGHFANEKIELPIQTFVLAASMKDGVINVSNLSAQALEGSAEAQARIAFAGEQNSSVSLRIENMQLEALLRATQEGAPKYAGRIRTNLDATMDVSNPLETVNGSGRIEVDQGRFVDLPVIGGLVRTVQNVGFNTGQRKDRLETDLAFHPGEVRLSNLSMVSSTVAARGNGKIGYDGSLNLLLNAGPMEKVQEKLGQIGDIFGKLTDTLVKYQVTGTVAEPKIKVKPLGLGTG
jgi:hypothetical protein